jgi:hypothetical protein
MLLKDINGLIKFIVSFNHYIFLLNGPPSGGL